MSQSASSPLIVVLNGPNLNMLGLRQPHIYGSDTLDDVEVLCAETAEALGLAIDFRQTNGEGELVTWVPPPFLCLPGGHRRHLRLRHPGLRVGADRDRRSGTEPRMTVPDIRVPDMRVPDIRIQA